MTTPNIVGQQCWEFNFLLPLLALCAKCLVIPQRGKRGFPLGLELKKFAVNLNFGEKTAFLLRLVQDPAARQKWPALTSSFEGSNSGYAIKPKNQKQDKETPKHSGIHRRPGAGGDSAYERGGDARRLAKGVNFGFWPHLECSGQKAIIFSREGLV